MQFIRNFLGTLKNWWKRQRTLVKGLIILALIILIFILLGGKKEAPVVEAVVRQDLARTVSATGTVVSNTDLELSFQKSDLVRTINVTVGDKVYKGQVLATLQNGNEAASVQSARGTLLSAQAKYRKVLEGESDETVRLAEIAVENARRTMYSADLVGEPSINLDDDELIITGIYNGSQSGEYRVGFGRSPSEIEWEGLEKGITTRSDNAQSLGTRGLMIEMPDINFSFNSEWVIKIPNTSGSSYAANYNAYQIAIADLAIKKAQARSADVDVAQAEVVSAQGSLARAQADFEKTVIRAPSNGTITKVDIKLGEFVETFVPVITLQDIGNLYIEANINESNISNIEVGQPLKVTYDAFGKSEISETTVSSVDLGATLTDGIVNYRIKAVVPDASKVRSGMTANLSIQTAFSPGVIVIPNRVITYDKEGKAEVTVSDEKGENQQVREIEVGLKGDGGLVEVINGLTEGEHVLFISK